MGGEMMRNGIVIALLLSLVLCGCSESLFYRADPADFDAWVESMRGLDEGSAVRAISDWMHSNMRYEPDGLIDYPKPVERAWNQSGDCEDFALVACVALHRLGFSDYRIVSVFTADKGHAVCSNGLFFLGNWYPHTYVGLPGNWPAVARSVYPDWVRVTVRDTSWRIEFDAPRDEAK